MPKRAVSLLGVVGFGVLVATAIGASCGESSRSTTPLPVRRPTPSARLVVLTDLKGYLEPCGCTSRPRGGIDRMAARLSVLRRGVPTAFVAAGDLFFSSGGHGGLPGAETQEHWKAETLVDILNDLDLAAASIGSSDLSEGPEVFSALLSRSDFPVLAAGLAWSPSAEPDASGPEAGVMETGPDPDAESEENALVPGTVIELNELKVGLLGISVLGAGGALPEGVDQQGDRLEAAKAQARELSEAGAQVIVGLVVGDRRLARRLASTAPEVDFIVLGGLDEDEAIPPSRVNETTLLHAGRQGQGLLVLDLYRRGTGRFADWSEWSVEVERARLETRIGDLRSRIEQWKQQGDVQAGDVERQEARLAQWERQLASLRVPARVDGNAFDAEWIPLEQDADRDASVTSAMKAYDRRVNSHNRELFADLRPEPVAEGAPHYVGSPSCQSCHESEFSWWRSHAHGRAYATLVERDKEFNLSCVGCHVTGYMKAGGSTVTHNLDGALVDVGCESCHGPASAHVENPEAPDLVALEAPESLCVTCHNPEHSDRFIYQGYMAAIVVPGHGLPSAE